MVVDPTGRRRHSSFLLDPEKSQKDKKRKSRSKLSCSQNNKLPPSARLKEGRGGLTLSTASTNAW